MKTREKKAMKRVSLKQVAQKCISDPAFYRALLRDPDRALARAGMHSSARDLRTAKRLISNKKALKDMSIYVKLVRKYKHTQYFILW